MVTTTATALSGPDASTSRAGERGAPRRRRRGWITAALAMAPFSIYVTLGLFVPIGAVVVLTFQDDRHHFTTANFAQLFHGVYAQGFINSMKLAAFSSVIPAIIGVVGQQVGLA